MIDVRWSLSWVLAAGWPEKSYLNSYSLIPSCKMIVCIGGGGDNAEFEIKGFGREDMACQFSVASAEELGASG